MWYWKGYDLPRDLALLARSFFLLVCYSIRLRYLPCRDILKGIAGLERPKRGKQRPVETTGETGRETLDKTWRALNFYLHRIYRSKKPCLRRTLVLYHCCRRLGLEARAVVGVCKENDELLSHAWLLLEGVPFHENPGMLARYTPILEG